MECILKFKCLKERPKQAWYKRVFFVFTRPLAKLIYRFDDERNKEIAFKRKVIADLNKRDFINEVSGILYDEVMTRGTIESQNEVYCKILCRDEAREIFEERKQNGGFDELNVMI